MNPSLIVLPEEFSLPDRDMLEKLKAIYGTRGEQPFLQRAQASSRALERVLSGTAVPTSLLRRMSEVLATG